MRIDDVDPDELDDDSRGRRRWWVAGAFVAVAAIVTVAVVVIGGDDDQPDAEPVAVTTEPPVTEPEPEEPIDVDGPALDGFPDWGSDYMGPRLEVLHQRVTEAGIRLTVFDNGNWFMEGDFGEEGVVFDAPAETIAAAPADAADSFMPFPGPDQGPDGWVPEPWCTPVGGFRVTMTFRDAVGVASGQRYEAPRDGLAATLFSSGYAEGSPFRVLVLQVAPDTTEVSVEWDDGATDTAVPTGGWVALATPGEPSGKFVLTLAEAGGLREVAWDEVPRDGDEAWMEGCTPPPPELPPAGEQPDDPAAAEAEIRAAFELLWDTDVPFEEKGDLVLDDTTGVAEAVDQVMEGGFGDTARTATHTMTELVFVSPDEAWFTYDIDSTAADFTNRFGIAYRIDGRWYITRAVICQDLSLAGGQCIPFAEPITPPAG